MPDRIVLTGGAGFLGSHLCERLLQDGCEVICVDNFVTGSLENVRHLLTDDRFTVVRADVSAEIPVNGPVDAILHLASPASPVDYLKFPVETLMAGSLGSRNALELARKHDARFLVASTSEVYGDPLISPQPETYWGNVNPIGPRAVYDEAKRFSEALTTAYRRTYGVRTTIIRIFNTFGPRMRPHDGRVVPTFIRQALAGEPLTVAGDGEQTRSLCYVSDLVDGLLRLLRSGHPGPMNIGNPHEVSMLELARWIRDLVGSTSEITFVPRPEDDPSVRKPDITLARAELGWEPQHPVEYGLKHTIDWFQRRNTEPVV